MDHSSEAHWISIRHLQRVAVYLGAHGLDAAACLLEAGIDPACLRNGDGKVGLVAVERLLTVVQRDIPVSNIGIDLARGPGTATLSWACLAGGPVFRGVGAEFTLGAASTITRTLAPNLPRPVVVRLQHAAATPRAHAALVDHFECPVHMKQADNAIVIPAALLNVRLPHGDAGLKRVLEQRALNLLALRRERATMLDEVRRHVRQAVERGTPARPDVARRLSLSESTLHRRLQEEGTSQALVDEVRLQTARHTLAQGSLTASLIASRLGFSSPQVFARWFRQQTGLTPGQYREQASQKPMAEAELMGN